VTENRIIDAVNSNKSPENHLTLLNLLNILYCKFFDIHRERLEFSLV